MLGILLMILAFVALVVIHERGHMTAAKKIGVKVTEFGIGIPPRVATIGKDTSGTKYSLNLIPLGGFVRLAGDNPTDTRSFTMTGSYLAASRWRKLIILIAGVVMNILTARIIFTILFAIGTPPLSILPDESVFSTHLMPTMTQAEERGIITIDESLPAQIIATQTGSRAAEEGLLSGTTIISIDNIPTTIGNISNQLQSCKETACTIEWITPENQTQTAAYQCVDSCLLGIMLDTSNSITIHKIHYPRYQAPLIALQEISQQTRFTFSSLGHLISTLRSGSKVEKQEATSQLSGPVGIVGVGQSIIAEGARSQWWILIGMISLALGLFNLLPIPALDGGRMLGVIIQSIGRIQPSTYYKIEGIINSVIMILLLGLGILIMAKDAAQFYCWENPLSQAAFGDSAHCIQPQQ